MIASVVLALAVLSVSGAMAVSSTQSNTAEIDAQSLSLARQFMEQLAALPFDPPEGSTGATPDDINDFNGYSDYVVPGANLSAANSFGGLKFSRKVAVEHRATSAGAAAPGGDLALITVTVKPQRGASQIVLRRLVTRYTREEG